MKKTLFAMLLLITIALSVTIVACSNEVKKVAVTGVTLNKTATSITVSHTDELKATITPENASNKKVTWSSSNTDVATVDANGIVTAITSGTSVITVTTEDGGFTATCNVTVTSSTVPVQGVKLNKTATNLTVGGTETLTATVSPTDATVQTKVWSSSFESVATVNNGVVTGVSAGTATITVTINGVHTATCEVTVTSSTVPVQGVKLNKTATNLTVGGTETLTATVEPTSATNKFVSWLSNDLNVASVIKTDDSHAVVTAVGKGTATIMVLTAEGAFSEKCNVTVTEASGPSGNFITFSSSSPFTVTIPFVFKGTLQYYSTANSTWTDLKATTTSDWGIISSIKTLSCTDLQSSADGKLYLRGNNKTITAEVFDYQGQEITSGCEWRISATSGVTLSGNIMSLLNCDSPATLMTSPTNAHCFNSLFKNCTSLTDISGLILPAATLAQNCYTNMFSGCTNLTEAPKLSAETLANSCYSGMFNGCTGLTSAPVLPATTLARNCYYQMFSGCTSLTKAPELPATTLADSCYFGMFNGCKSLAEAPALQATTLTDNCYNMMFCSCDKLEKAPELPAKILAANCYRQMFNECKSLTTAPKLSATTLADRCCDMMFSRCEKLTKAPELPAETLADYCYKAMFSDCSSLHVTTDSDFSAEQKGKIFTCPPSTGGLYSPVGQMFSSIGTDIGNNGTPTSGTDYYWYIPSTT